MPCLAMHLAIAKKYTEKHPEEKIDFIKGTIAPDISEDKKESHYGDKMVSEDPIEYLKKKVNLVKFLENNTINSNYDRAYFLHLICDKIFYNEIMESGTLEGKGYEEIRSAFINDYNRITTYLIEKYQLEVPSEIEKIISTKCEGELEILDIKKIEEFIERMANIDLEQFGDETYMRAALEEAKTAYQVNEVPIGAVIVKDGKIIAKGHNEKEKTQDVTKHAEITAIQDASKYLNNWRLNECTMYVTLKPCNMCTGAISQSRIKRVVIGTLYESLGSTESHGVGVCDFDEKTEVTIGILENECRSILQEFFKELRK